MQRMHQSSVFDENIWKEFLLANPTNLELCSIVCRGSVSKERAWQELVRRGLNKGDFHFLFRHLRNAHFVNWKVWELFKQREDISRKDIEIALGNPKLDRRSRKDARELLGKIKSEEPISGNEKAGPPKEEGSDKNKKSRARPEGKSLPCSSHPFVVRRKKRRPAENFDHTPPWKKAEEY